MPEAMKTSKSSAQLGAVRSQEKAQLSSNAVLGNGGSRGEAGDISEGQITGLAWPAEKLGNDGIQA